MEVGNGENIITGGGVTVSQPASVADDDRFAVGIAEAEEAAG